MASIRSVQSFAWLEGSAKSMYLITIEFHTKMVGYVQKGVEEIMITNIYISNLIIGGDNVS